MHALILATALCGQQFTSQGLQECRDQNEERDWWIRFLMEELEGAQQTIEWDLATATPEEAVPLLGESLFLRRLEIKLLVALGRNNKESNFLYRIHRAQQEFEACITQPDPLGINAALAILHLNEVHMGWPYALTYRNQADEKIIEVEEFYSP